MNNTARKMGAPMRLSWYLFSLSLLSTLFSLTALPEIKGLSLISSMALAQSSSFEVAIDSSLGTGAIASPLKSGDRIRITVTGFPELSGEQLIPASGVIQLPMAGGVQAIGLTPLQLTERLTEVLTPYVRRPQVSVAIVELSPLRVSVTGEVLSPGPRLLNPSEVARQVPLTLSSVLKLSGGVTPNADLRSIVIRRSPLITNSPQTIPSLQPITYEDGTLTTTPSATRELSVNLWQAIASGELEADPLIYDGDEIIVPTSELPNEERQALLESTVAPDTINVQVIGEVKNPGDVNATPLTDLNTAIGAAGGFTENADEEDIRLLRLLPDGRVAFQDFEFGQASGPLLSGDLIVVGRRRRSRIRDVFDFVGSVLNPINTGINIFRD